MDTKLKLRPIVSGYEMQQFEQRVLKGDLELAGLWMDRAALAMARWLLARFAKPCSWRYTLILAGPGGNGGDAWALARYLKQAGWDPLVAFYAPTHPLTIARAEAAKKEGVRHMSLSTFLENPHEPLYDLIVDGLLGIGAHGALTGQMKDALAFCNSLSNPKLVRLALDCPSGWQAGSGITFHSDHTLCVQYIKKELLAPEVLKDAGQLHVIDLKLEELGTDDPPSTWKMLDANTQPLTPPAPSRIANKYTRGVVYLIAGSEAYPGSAHLAEHGAWWMAPGMVYTSSASPALEKSVHLKEPPSQLRAASVLAIGPGMDLSQESFELLTRYLASSHACRARVIDAGALTHLSRDGELLSLLKTLGGFTLLTPHEGELDRLLVAYEPGYLSKLAIDEKIAYTQAFCQKHQLYVLFKGPISYLLGPTCQVLVEPFASAQLAQGGSGDRLTGMIASSLARGLDPIEAILYALRAPRA